MINLDFPENEFGIVLIPKTISFPNFGRQSTCTVVSSKYPNCFKFELKGENCIIRDAILWRGNHLLLNSDRGVSYPVIMLQQAPLGKNFLGFGTALAVYTWSDKLNLTLLKVALPDDLLYRFYAVIDCLN